MAGNILFNSTQIQKEVERLAGEISGWLESRSCSVLNLICVLEGARPFARDLSAELKSALPELEHKHHEVRIQGTNGTALLTDRFMKSPLPSPGDFLPGPLLIVDDLVDSGLTLKILRKELGALSSQEIKTAVLIRKYGDLSGPVDFYGFDLELTPEGLKREGLRDKWLFGYGMDLDGRQRDLDYIGWVEVR